VTTGAGTATTDLSLDRSQIRDVTAGAAYREELYRAFSDSDRDIEEMVSRALTVGTDYFGVPIGFLTRIRDGTQEIRQSTGDHDLLQPGETCPLDDAYCRRTVETTGTLSVQDVNASGAIPQQAVDAFGLETYIGAKVVVDNETYGTVCFADTASREDAFSEAEELFVELFAKLVGQAFEQRVHERQLEARKDRVEAEKRRFEGIAENSFDVLFRLDGHAEFTYVSSAVERVLGYAPDDMRGEQFADFLVADTVPEALDAFGDLLDGDAIEGLELTFRDAAGDRVLVDVNATPVFEDGAVVGVQGVGRDVTERRAREAELRVKNRAVADAAIGVTIADATADDLPLVYANDAFERITGYEESEVLGRNCRFLQGEDTQADRVAALRAGIEAEESVSVELLNYRRDGTPFWNELTVTPVHVDADGTEADDNDGDGERSVTHFVGFQADVTGRKRTERLVELLNRVLRHNLGNDMNTVLGYADLLQAGDADVTSYAERIEETASSLVALSEHARELETYARRERDPQRLDTAALLDRVATTTRQRFPEATIEVAVETDRGLCAGPEVERALAELSTNAVKHNPAAEPAVSLTAADAGDEVRISVVDDGPGVGASEVAAITSGEETALEHGSGLGLWLVNWVVTRYGGSFTLERPSAGGTEAAVALPGLDAETPVSAAVRQPTPLFR
jgi:PAS domain S-box-containing protein